MGGIRKICKLMGGMITSDEKGNKIHWIWDYAKDEPVKKEEMTKDRYKASEKAKWEGIKKLKDNQQ